MGSVFGRVERCDCVRSHYFCGAVYLSVFRLNLALTQTQTYAYFRRNWHMADATQFTIGDTVSVFEGTHQVRGRRSTKLIGKVVGFDTERNLWKVVYTAPLP